MKKKLIAVMFVLILTCMAVCFVACTDNGEKVSYTATDLFWKTPEYSSVIYSVKANKLTLQELETLASLQGIVAQTTSAIYINYSDDCDFWLNKCRKDYGLQVVEVDDVWQLIDSFKSYLNSGKYVLYDSTADEGVSYLNQSINYATVVSGVERYLMVSSSLESVAQQHGLTLGKDVRYSTTREIFDSYKSSLCNSPKSVQVATT